MLDALEDVSKQSEPPSVEAVQAETKEVPQTKDKAPSPVMP